MSDKPNPESKLEKPDEYPGPGEWPPELVAEPVFVPYVVVRPWDHGTLFTCSLCGNYPDFPTREDAELHLSSHSTTIA